MSTKSDLARDETASAGLRALMAKLEIAGLRDAIYLSADSNAETDKPSIDRALAVVPAAAFSHILDKVIVDPGRHTDIGELARRHDSGRAFARYQQSVKGLPFRLVQMERGEARLPEIKLFYGSSRGASGSGTAIDDFMKAIVGLLKKQAETQPSEQSPREILKDKAIAAIARLVEKADDETCLRALSAPDEASSLINFLASAGVAGILAEETRDPLATAVARGVGYRKSLIEAEGGTASGQQIAELLGLTRQAVDKRRKNNRLLAIPTGSGNWRYPLWQIQDHKVLLGLEGVLDALTAVGPWTKLHFFLSPTEELRDSRPIDFLRLGKWKEVIECAKRLEEQGAR